MFFRFVLRGPGYNLNDLKSISDWVLDRQYKQVEGIAESSSFGGTVKQYEVAVSPEALKRYGLTLSQVQNAVANSNANVGGDILRLGAENFDVRGLGLLGAGSDPAVDLPRERSQAIGLIRLREDAKARELRQVVIAAVGGVPITLGQIVSAVDGPIVAGDFGQPHENGACQHEGQCVLLTVWSNVGEHMREHLDSFTLADMVSRALGVVVPTPSLH